MTSVLTIVPILALLGALLMSVKRIPEGQVYTLRRLGRPAGILTAGTHVVVPFIEHIAHKISITGYTLAVDERIGHASTNAHTLRGRVWWQVLDPERAETVIDRADELIRLRLHDALQHTAAGEADPDVQARNQRIKQSLNGSLRERGVLVTRVELNLAA